MTGTASKSDFGIHLFQNLMRAVGVDSDDPSLPAFEVVWIAAWQAAYAQALEDAARAITDHQRAGREWVAESLWDTLSREAATRIRALASGDKG